MGLPTKLKFKMCHSLSVLRISLRSDLEKNESSFCCFWINSVEDVRLGGRSVWCGKRSERLKGNCGVLMKFRDKISIKTRIFPTISWLIGLKTFSYFPLCLLKLFLINFHQFSSQFDRQTNFLHLQNQILNFPPEQAIFHRFQQHMLEKLNIFAESFRSNILQQVNINLFPMISIPLS